VLAAPAVAGCGVVPAVVAGPVVSVDAQPTANASAPAASQEMLRMFEPPEWSRPCKLRTGDEHAHPGAMQHRL
jgi:hypothetical protein